MHLARHLVYAMCCASDPPFLSCSYRLGVEERGMAPMGAAARELGHLEAFREVCEKNGPPDCARIDELYSTHTV